MNENRPFLVHLKAEHQALREAMDETIEARAQADFFAMKHCVLELAHLLTMHFREEETDGCCDEAVSRTPLLSHVATELCHEHQQLMKTAHSLAESLEHPEEFATEQWDKGFNAFRFQLEDHLSREAQLVEAGLHVDCDPDREGESYE